MIIKLTAEGFEECMIAVAETDEYKDAFVLAVRKKTAEETEYDIVVDAAADVKEWFEVADKEAVVVGAVARLFVVVAVV